MKVKDEAKGVLISTRSHMSRVADKATGAKCKVQSAKLENSA